MWVAGFVACQKLPTVTIPNGNIQGTLKTSYNGKTYMQFTGIPYANPPIGNLRFEVYNDKFYYFL